MVPHTPNATTLILLLLVLFEMSMGAYSRPIGRKERSSEDVLMGVDFLSIILNSAGEETKGELQNSGSSLDTTEQSNKDQQLGTTVEYEITTIKELPVPKIKKIRELRNETPINKTKVESTSKKDETKTDIKEVSRDIQISGKTTLRKDGKPQGKTEIQYEIKENVLTSTESQTDGPSTRKEKTVKRQTVTFVTTTEKPPTIVPITLLSLEMNTEVYISKNRPVNEKDRRPTVLIHSPSEINLESKKNDFSVELSEPITLENKRPSSENTEINAQIKPEEIIARGANPDYIAQQIARIQKERQNDPYNPKRSPSRARAVSYSSAVQVLPHSNRNRPLETHSRNNHGESAHISSSNIYNIPYDRNSNVQTQEFHMPLSTHGQVQSAYNGEDYDYSQLHTGPDQNKNVTRGPADATAESKDYFVTRKYNPDEYNDSREKPIFRPGPIWAGSQLIYNKSKSAYQPRESSWGAPESNYEEEENDDESTPTIYNKAEVSYEIDEASSVLSNGRIHGAQKNVNGDKTIQLKVGQKPANPDDNQKIGYVVEGRNYKKYRVEERTPDGFIVGEYGVVSNNDGSLRGVRYTADGTINPRVIYDALMKFLSL